MSFRRGRKTDAVVLSEEVRWIHSFSCMPKGPNAHLVIDISQATLPEDGVNTMQRTLDSGD